MARFRDEFLEEWREMGESLLDMMTNVLDSILRKPSLTLLECEFGHGIEMPRVYASFIDFAKQTQLACPAFSTEMKSQANRRSGGHDLLFKERTRDRLLKAVYHANELLSRFEQPTSG